MDAGAYLTTLGVGMFAGLVFGLVVASLAATARQHIDGIVERSALDDLAVRRATALTGRQSEPRRLQLVHAAPGPYDWAADGAEDG